MSFCVFLLYLQKGNDMERLIETKRYLDFSEYGIKEKFDPTNLVIMISQQNWILEEKQPYIFSPNEIWTPN